MQEGREQRAEQNETALKRRERLVSKFTAEVNFHTVPLPEELNFGAVVLAKKPTFPQGFSFKRLTDVFILPGAFLLKPRRNLVVVDISCLTVAIISQPAALYTHSCLLTFEPPHGFSPEVSDLFTLWMAEQMGWIPALSQL